MPAWSHETTRSPILSLSNSIDSAQIQIVVDPQQGCGYGGRLATAKSSGTPAVYYVVRITIGKCTSYSHYCGTVDDGCTTNALDDRIIVSHEIGLSLALGHCDLNYSVMCHVTGNRTNDFAEGTSYWTPQVREDMGLKGIYP